ncbi:DUF2520 domain-containing protein [candidate division WOR-3 bacterium]|nr:DUF2520 domain-containing protein [candidate division WOR-3 bacterium]
MRIGLIGCGRVGVTLFDLLRKNNTIVGVYDKKKQRERIAAMLLRIRHNPSYHELVKQSEALFLATPDDEILRAYAKMREHISGPTCIFHFSGILPADIIPRTPKVYRASVHPFATFPEIAVPARKRHYHISLEGDPPAIKAARAIFGARYFTLKKIRKQDKTLYHLTGVFSSNLLVALIASACYLAGKIGWTEKEIQQLIFPIIEQTLGNIKRRGLVNALSGPLVRGDVLTIEKHLRALRNDKTLLNVYKALSHLLTTDFAGSKKKRALRRILR